MRLRTRGRLAMLIGLAAVVPTTHPAAGDGRTSRTGVDELAGATCSLSSVVDSASATAPRRLGTLLGGPFAVGDVQSMTAATSVTVTCAIQFGSSDPAAPDAAVVKQNTGGPIGALASPVSYAASATSVAYLCTTVQWSSPSGGGTFRYDADRKSTGDQCARVSSGPGKARVSVAPCDVCISLEPHPEPAFLACAPCISGLDALVGDLLDQIGAVDLGSHDFVD